jgi:hypothetical protein
VAAVTLAQLRNRARVRCDMVNSAFIADADFNDFLNASADELYDILVEKYEDYFTTSSTLTTVSGTESYTVPADFYKLVGIDFQIDSTRWRALEPFVVRERNVYRNLPTIGFPGYELKYWLRGSNLNLLPVPTAAWTLKLWYVPRRAAMSADSDTFDGVSGWEEYIVVDAAIKALTAEEGDTSALEREKAQLLERTQKAASNRDAGSPARVADVSRDDFLYW